jgi:replicative DNA helicase
MLNYLILKAFLKAYFDRGGSPEALRLLSSLERVKDDSAICAVLYQLYKEGKSVSYEVFYKELQLYLKKNRKKLTEAEELLLMEVQKAGSVVYLELGLSDISYALEKLEEYLKLKSFKALMDRINLVVKSEEISDKELLTHLASELKKTYEEVIGVDIYLGKTRYISYMEDISVRPYYVSSGRNEKVKTGLTFIDNELTNGGLERGWFVVFAAGTGIGKTTLMTNIAAESFRLGHRVLYISLEMTEKEIARRIDSILTGVPLSSLMQLGDQQNYQIVNQPATNFYSPSPSDIHQQVVEKLKEVIKDLSGKNADLVITYYPSMSIHAFYVRNILSEFKLMGKEFDIVIIDFADYFKSSTTSDAPYWESVAEAFKYLPGIARENNVVIITATEINKRDAERGDVTLASVYGSSSKAFGADLVLGIERSGDQLDRYGDSGVRIVRVLKYRHGPSLRDFRIQLDPKTLKVRVL